MTTRLSTWLSLLLLVLLSTVTLNSTLIAADPPLPTLVHLLAVDPSATEGNGDAATFVVIRVGPTNGPLMVHYTVGGSASNGVDYERLCGEVEIPSGAFIAPITVTPIDDFLVERTESVIVSLVPPPNLPPDYYIDWPYLGFAHIEDDDLEPTNHPPVVALVNPPDGSVFTAPLDLVLVAKASDSDGHVRTVEFFDGTNSLGIVTNGVRLPITPLQPVNADMVDPDFVVEADVFPDLDLQPIGDPVPVPLNAFRLFWHNVPPGRHLLTAVATDNRGGNAGSRPVNITVLEAPPQPVVTVKASDPEGAEPNPLGARIDTARFTIYRTGNTDFPLTVFYQLSGTASNGVDYRELPSSVAIPAGERSTDVMIAPIDDPLVEGDESVVITILPPICIAIYPPPPDCYLVGRAHAARAVIHDNDTPPNQPPVVRILRPTDGSVFLAPADIAIVAEARDYDGRVRTVEFFEGTNSLGIVTNRPTLDSNSTDKSALRPPFMLVWSNVPPGHYVFSAVATDDDGATGRSGPVEIKVVARPAVPVVSIEATDPAATEPGNSTGIDAATFKVSRSGDTERSLTVFYAISGTASNGVDYRRLPGSLTIPAGAGATNVIVDPLDDRLVEGTETVVLTLAPSPLAVAGASPVAAWNLAGYIIGSNYQARAIIRDNDVPPTNQPPKVEIASPRSGQIFTAPADILMSAAAGDPDGYVQTVEFFANGKSLGTVSNTISRIDPASDPVAVEAETTLNAEQLFRLWWRQVQPGGYELTAKATDNRGVSSVSEPVRIKVIEASLPVVTIEATDAIASEGYWLDPIDPIDPVAIGNNVAFIGPPIVIERLDPATFTVRRSGGTNLDLTVYYTVNGTASNGVDYRELSGKVTIQAGSWSAPIVVLPIDDKLAEETETVVLTLDPLACPAIFPPPPGCYMVGDPNRAVAYIRDNDANLPPKVEIVHPSEGAVFPAKSDIEIDVVTVDLDGWVGTMEFYEGTNLLGTQTINFFVPPPPGQVQKFSLTWSNVPTGAYTLTARAVDDQGAKAWSDPVHIRVTDLGLPVVTIVARDSVASEIDPRLDIVADPAIFEVKRSGDLSSDLRVLYRVGGTASNGIDYQKLSGEVVIPKGSAAAEIEIDVIDDKLVEGTESVIITLQSLPCLTANLPASVGCYLVGRPGSDVAYIRDNDMEPNRPPKVALTSPANGAVFTAPADIRLAAAAEDPDGWVHTVEFFAGGRSLGIVTNRPWILEPVRLTNYVGALLTDVSSINPFMILWPNVPVGHYVLTAVATDNLGASSRSAPSEITVLEPTHLPIVNIIAIDPFAREGATNPATFRVRRLGDTNGPLTVLYAIAGSAQNGVDYLHIPGSVTIPAGRRSARITVQPVDDRLREPVETVILRLQQPSTTPPSYIVGVPAGAVAIIVDNDRPRPGCTRLSDGNVHLWMPLANGMSYRLEASEDLFNWTALFSNVVTDDGLDFIDDESAKLKARFYRVVQEMDQVEGDD